MIPQEALLPHETYCERCGGEGWISGYSGSNASGPTQIDCPADCAQGVVAKERRDLTKRLPDDAPLRQIFEEVRRLIADLEIRADELRAANDSRDGWRATAQAFERRNATLVEENRRLRAAVAKAAQRIELGMHRTAALRRTGQTS